MIMKNILVLFLLLSMCLFVHVAADSCIDPSMEINIDRPGMDYKNFDLNDPNPCDCMNECTLDSKCKAYTYVKPGVQGPSARCWLKSDVPAPVPDNNCTSGVATIHVKGVVTCSDSTMQDKIDRPGLDYKNFDLEDENPCNCMVACANDKQCKAYTYVEPGVQGPSARCWLKSGVPMAVPNEKCVSGTKYEINNVNYFGSVFFDGDNVKLDKQKNCLSPGSVLEIIGHFGLFNKGINKATLEYDINGEHVSVPVSADPAWGTENATWNYDRILLKLPGTKEIWPGHEIKEGAQNWKNAKIKIDDIGTNSSYPITLCSNLIF